MNKLPRSRPEPAFGTSLFAVLPALGLLASPLLASPVGAQSYDLKLHAGLNLVANQLDQGGNTLNEVLPRVPDGSALYKYDNASNAWTLSTFSAAAGKWLEGDSIILNPGEGAFFDSPSDVNLTWTGKPHLPVLPVAIPDGQLYLLSRQTNDVGSYVNIVGKDPAPGAQVYRWNGAAYDTYSFDAKGVWTPSEPVASVGEAVWISRSGAPQPPPTPNSSGFTILSPSIGDTLCAGGTTTITWTGGNPTWNVAILVIDVPSWTVSAVVTPSTLNTGSFFWNIPSYLPPSTYEVHIKEVTLLTWAYGGNFTISGPCPTNPCVPPPPGMGLWLPFDETSGSSSTNLVPGGNNGTQMNTPSVIGGYVSNSLSFNGVNQYVTVPDYPAINPGAGQDFSMDAWVKRPANSPSSPPSVIVDKRAANTGIGYSLALSFGNLVFQMNDGSGFTNYRDTGTVPADDRWHFVAVTVTRNQTNGGRFYIDGSLTSSFDPTGKPGSLASPAAFQVAASVVTGNIPWLGAIDEVEFFRRALLPQEVQSIYLAGPAGKCKQACGVAMVPTGTTNKVVECGSKWGFDTPTAYDACCSSNLTVTVLNTVTNLNAASPCSLVIIRTWQATGCSGDSATWSQTVTVVDTTPPVVNCAPGFATDCSFPWSFTPPTASDACSGTNVTITVLNTTTNGRCPYVISRTWLVSDACGNSTNCTQTVVVGDFTPPVLTCAGDKTVECGTDWSFDVPRAYDACCGTNVTLEVLNTVTNFNPKIPCSQVITRTWVAADCCGNTNTCSQTVTTQDTTPPLLSCARDKTVECGSSWAFDPPTALDVCCGDKVAIAVVSTFTNNPGLSCKYSVTRTWSATDCCGNSNLCTQTVTVADTTGPVFATACVTNTIRVGGNNFTTSIPAAPSPGLLTRLNAAGIQCYKNFDECRINCYFAHTFTNLPHCLTAATLTVRLKPCGDICYNDAIGVSFTSPAGVLQPNSWSRFLGAGNPQAGLVSDSWCNHTAGQVFVLDLAALPQPSGPPLNLLPQLNALGYLDFTSQDDSGVDYLELTVTSCCYQPNKTVECGSRWSFDPPSATDACCGTNVTISVVSTATNGTCPKVVTRTWQATDCCGNASFFSQNVTLVDTTPPVVYCPGPITVYTCSNSARAYFHVYAFDACSGYRPVTCTPPSGSSFPLGTTIVSCTATDLCGNLGACSFSVTVTQQIVTASVLLGLADCYQLPTEPAPKSAALLAAHPTALWKNFDDPNPNRSFGASFLGLPRTLTCGQLILTMKPNCSDIPQNDSLSIGLLTNSTGGFSNAWFSYIGGGNASPGLLPAPWCDQSGCAQQFTFNLASMPLTGANLLPLINAQGKLDLYLQDDTIVDSARLNYCYCRVRPSWNGYDWNLVNAELAIGQGFASISPLWSLGYQTNFSVSLAPGATHGIQLNLQQFNLGSTAGSRLTVSARTTLDPEADALQLTSDGSGGIQFLLKHLRAKTSEAVVNVRLAGVLVAHTNRPPTIGASLLSLTGAGALTRIQTTRDGTLYSFEFEEPATAPEFGGVLVDAVEIALLSSEPAPDNLLASLDLDLDGLPELRLTGAATEVSGLFPQLTGETTAVASGDPLTITPVAAPGTAGENGFTVSSPPTGQFTLTLNVAQNLAGESQSNGLLTGVFTGSIGPEWGEVSHFAFTQSADGWDLQTDLAALGATDLRAQVFNQGVLVAEVPLTGRPHLPVLPTSLGLSARPPFASFIWPGAQSLLLAGTLYTGDELRLGPVNPDLPLTAITGVQVRASGVDALSLTFVGQPPPLWTLQAPLLTPGGMLIRWTGPVGGLLESAPGLLGPWTPVSGQSNNAAVVESPLVNGTPMQFFRVRAN